MSRSWGYVCLSHDPPLASEPWLNHGDGALASAFHIERAGRWPVDQRFPILEEPVPVVSDRSYPTAAPIHWLREHPSCEVALQDEYGRIKRMPDRPETG